MFAVRRNCAPHAAMSHRIRYSEIDVRPSAIPPTMQAHMPAIEIAFGETFRAASHAVASCAHFRFLVAIGRRSPDSAAVLFIVQSKSITGTKRNTQMKGFAPSDCLIALRGPGTPSGASTSQSKDLMCKTDCVIDHPS